MTRFTEAEAAALLARAAKRRAAIPTLTVVAEVNAGDRRRPALPHLALALPWPPTINHSHNPNGRGGKILTVESKKFRADVKAICRGMGWPRVEGRLSVSIVLFAPDRRHYDIDNRIKAVLDALQAAAVMLDDEAVDHIEIRRFPVTDVSEGRCHVIVKAL